MIFTLIILGMMELIRVIFSALPNLPSTPSAITTAGNYFATNLAGVVSVLQMVVGSALLTAIISVVVALWAFETLYHPAMWLIKKIPFINIK